MPLKGKDGKMKKTTILTTVIAVLLAGSSFAAGVGSVFGTQATAEAVGHRVGYFGVGVGIADLTSFVGTFDYGFSKYTTGRLKLGFADEGSATDMSISFGGEIRWQLWQAGGTSKRPLDLAVGAMSEYMKFSDRIGTVETSLSVFQFGGFVLGSHAFVMSNGKLITPYAKLNVRLEDTNAEVTGLPGTSSSDLRVGLGSGLSYSVSNTMNLYGEFQVDGNEGVFFGVDFKVM
jgi:hypothetical protein